MSREPLATTVAATDIDDQRLWIANGVASNYGACVDLWAPGTNIQSASHTSDTATEFRSGTSQSAPFVAGAAALYLQNVTGALRNNSCLLKTKHCLQHGSGQAVCERQGAA